MKEGTATVHASTVREFLQIISDQAKAATAGLERPGLLQMSRLHPSSETLVPSRYAIADVEHRSEEHTSELQSRGHLVCRLLLEKKKHKTKHTPQAKTK